MIERMKTMKETLMNCVSGQLGDLAAVDAKELGEAIDMIKDLSEAIYYCTITESMQKTGKDEKYGQSIHHSEPMYSHDYRYYGGNRDLDKRYGRMSYEGDRNYREDTHPIEIRDYKEGRSPITRKTYMERKIHGDSKEMQMQELEKYMHELTEDIMEMVEDASVEEKQILKNKISKLATKIV